MDFAAKGSIASPTWWKPQSGSAVLVINGNNALYGLNPDNGEMLWTVEGGSQSTPVASGDWLVLYSGTEGGDTTVTPLAERAMRRVFARHAHEFTADMTALVKLQTAKGLQKVRIFSLRGAYLLGMFARTAKAEAFRRSAFDQGQALEGLDRRTREDWCLNVSHAADDPA